MALINEITFLTELSDKIQNPNITWTYSSSTELFTGTLNNRKIEVQELENDGIKTYQLTLYNNDVEYFETTNNAVESIFKHLIYSRILNNL